MKKLLFVTLIMLVAVSLSSLAQTKFGLKAGVNITNLGGDADDYDARIAPYFGGFASFAISEKLSFQPELLYSMKGAKSSYTEEEEGIELKVEETLKLTYLDIPLMFKYNVGGRLNLQAGPQVSLLLSAKNKYEGKAMGISFSTEEDLKDGFKGLDFGLGFGLGYDFGAIGIDAKYNLGLSNIADSEGDFKVTNNVIQIGVSYKF